MKINHDYIKKILKAVEDCSEVQMEETDLIKALSVDPTNQDDRKKLDYHIKYLGDKDYLVKKTFTSPDYDAWDPDHALEENLRLITAYELTWQGHDFLRKIHAGRV